MDSRPLDRNRLRCHTNRRPELIGHIVERFGPSTPWKSEWGTRLRGFFLKGSKIDEAKRLPDHDDWDCLEDMEQEGLLEILSYVNSIVRFTNLGLRLAAHLRKHKANGGHFATFDFKSDMLITPA